MKKNKSNSVVGSFNLFFLVVLTAGLLGGLGYFLFSAYKQELPVLGEPGHTVGSFSFINQDGRPFSAGDINGKIRVSEFFFTTCKSICPIMNNNLKEVQSAFRDRTDVVILSHTVDPKRDDPTRLKEYARQMQAIPGKWEFLTGEKKDLYKMALNDYLLGVDSTHTEITDSSFIHTQFIALVDKEDRIRGFYDATDKKEITKLIADIRRLN